MNKVKDMLKKIAIFGMIFCLLAGVIPTNQIMAAGKTTVVTLKGKSDVNGKKYTVKVTFDKKSGKATKVKFISGKKSKTISKISTPGNDPSVYWSDDMSFSMCIWYKNSNWTVKNISKIIVTDPKYSGTYVKK